MLAPAFYRRVLCLAAPALLAGARAAHAQTPEAGATVAGSSPLALSWTSSDPSCDGAAVGARALELVARGVTPRPTEARAQVSRDGDQWVVDLETRSESNLGHRTLRGESCQELQQAIALLLAMIMESEAKTAAPPPPAAAPAPPPALGPSLDSGQPPEHDEPPRLPPPAPPRRGWGGVMRAHGLAALGLQPGLGLGVGGAVGGAWGPFELLVSGAFWPSSRASIFDRDGVLEINRKVLGLTACYEVWSAGPLRAVPCLSPELMWLEWRSLGLRKTNQGGTNHTEALTAYLDLRTEVFGPVFISLLPGLTWEHPRPFRAKKCEDCSASDVFQLWGIGPILGAGVGARF